MLWRGSGLWHKPDLVSRSAYACHLLDMTGTKRNLVVTGRRKAVGIAMTGEPSPLERSHAICSCIPP
ncbi:hypothetical protein J437_LFUL014628 [Ladona fulva]|uniref:Uncharacterized protein n=1 Tax=Ladona fulva TaxID=123851 RepID=A0A8K0KKM5_LADFU|nr:hypothetical protein J437_LFUL014628 [Ladona fulva]